MNPHLVLHSVAYAIDTLLFLLLIFFVFFKSKKNSVATVTILLFVGSIIFVVSHAVGVAVGNSEFSHAILMFNLVVIFLPVLGAHCVFAVLGAYEKHKKGIVISYIIAFGLIGFFALNPSFYLLQSVPKLYFPNYYVPGPYYWVMLAFFFSVLVYLFFWMYRSYIVSNEAEKNRIRYFFLAFVLGYMIGATDFLLVYNIPFDPLWGALFGPLYAIPFTYAVVQYELMDIKLIAKKAFSVALIAACVSAVLIILNYANAFIISRYPTVPNWLLPLALGIVAAATVMFIWRKIREADVLKYEFITTVTHKFRTPLTAIKWSGEMLLESVPENLKEGILTIQANTDRLVELTNLLVGLSGIDDKTYAYQLGPLDLDELVAEIVREDSEKAAKKDIHVLCKLQPFGQMLVDRQRIKFVFQTLIDNAISYTPRGGSISIESAPARKGMAAVRISDTGIGIRKEDLKYIFSKFYRTDNGRRADTEGMGIGLYLAKHIIERHGGSMSVESEGEGKGTTFLVSLPLTKP